MENSINYPANSCQAYHTPSYLQDRINNIPYNKHLCFVHKNISFYCLLSEYVNLRPDGSFVHPHTLDYVARNLRTSLLQVHWPDRLDRRFMEYEMANMFMGLDSTFLEYLRKRCPSFVEEMGFSCCSISLMLCQGGIIWGVQLGKNRIGLCSASGDLGIPSCISPCNEHSYESDTEKTRLINTGLTLYSLSEFFQFQHCFMPTRCIGNLHLKEDYHNTVLCNANSPPAICQPDIWGPVDIEYKRINHAFIINDDLYKVFERHCMFKLNCPVLEKVGEFIMHDHANNDNNKYKLFNDCGRRVIENVLKAVGPAQLNDLYKRYNIIDMGIIIADFDIRYYSSTRDDEAPDMTNELPSNTSGPLGFVVDPYMPGHTINMISPPPSIFPPEQFNLTTHQTVIQQQQFEHTYRPPKVTRSSSNTSTLPSSQPSSLPSSGVHAYLKFDANNPIWNIQSLEHMTK